MENSGKGRLDFELSLRSILGEGRGWLPAADGRIAAFCREPSGRFDHRPLGVARPKSVDQLRAVVELCAAGRVAIVPQGGNTGLNGGAVPGPSDRGIILSLGRMNRILAIDPVDLTVTVEAGVALTTLTEALAGEGLTLPFDGRRSDRGQIGGLISTNAGCGHLIRRGSVEDLILGLEVVLADGSIWDGARALARDSAGYQLKRLFCGAEGTLGIVTKAVLRVLPETSEQAAALVAVADLAAAEKVSILLRSRAADFLTSLSFFCDGGLTLALEHVPELTRPVAAVAPIYLVAELASAAGGIGLTRLLRAILAPSFADGTVKGGRVVDADAAERLAQLPSTIAAVQALEGPVLRHQLSVPFGRLPLFLSEAMGMVTSILPKTRVHPFGQLGLGVIHFNLLPPPGNAEFSGEEPRTLRGYLPRRGSPWRHHCRRMRHRPGRGRSDRPLSAAARDRADATHQARARPARDHESRQADPQRSLTFSTANQVNRSFDKSRRSSHSQIDVARAIDRPWRGTAILPCATSLRAPVPRETGAFEVSGRMQFVAEFK